MTLMVRDEADIIRPMIEHSLAQGVDVLIVTDNGSTDGTTEILESFGDRIDLRHDPVHRKQQHSVVTGMARDAYNRYAADWVVNADADEFWMPVAGGATIKDVLAEVPASLRAFTVPVVDMTGRPALRGTGFERLRFRDNRSVEELQRIGLRAHSTPDAVHVGDPEVEVAQGNHFVTLPTGELPTELGLEVLHLPWRSWDQFEAKVVKSGRAYESNPELAPSPNHHGMREYWRWKQGALFAYYVLRHPSEAELAAGVVDGTYVEDRRLVSTKAAVEDVFLDNQAEGEARYAGRIVAATERTLRGDIAAEHERYAVAVRAVEGGRVRIEELEERLHLEEETRGELETRLDAAQRRLDEISSRRVVRVADALARGIKRH
ncbi:glycosyltransferase family 2 protein [Leifsonia sp. LS1]|uniref:glycosyltransferase family 2 protein n=1 Tax=Leifsonia sp. LS1 TaxID=2828483 RepID=UPI001CFF1821|nr:glycosyltransferase family 2 protein [Leifsonia sp. LS1]